LRVSRGQLVEPGDPLHALGQPAATKLAALLILHVHVMVVG
jgi:hypothetical protein